jgi:hypothetical protein
VSRQIAVLKGNGIFNSIADSDGMDVDDLLNAEFMDGEEVGFAASCVPRRDRSKVNPGRFWRGKLGSRGRRFGRLGGYVISFSICVRPKLIGPCSVQEEKHRLSLATLKEKDPEFYKYLEENDRALLDFGEDGDGDEASSDEGEDDEEEEEEEEDDDDAEAVSSKTKGKAREEPEKLGEGQTLLTKDMLREWQQSIIEVRSCPPSKSGLPLTFQ